MRPVQFNWDPNAPVRTYRCYNCNLTFQTREILIEEYQRQSFQAILWKIIREKKGEPYENRYD